MRAPARIALIVETSNKYARELLHGIRAYVRKHEPWTIRFEEHSRGLPPRWIRRWEGDGIIARLENDEISDRVLSRNIPVVNVSSARQIPRVPCVKADDEAIARVVVSEFLRRGVRSFGFCHAAGYRWSELRADHFIRLVEAQGLRCSTFSSGVRGAPRDPFYQDADGLESWLHVLPKPVGIFAAWDGCGLKVLECCREVGFKVPDEVAVIGVDNDELLCDLADPPLSSVDPNAFRVGYEAAAILGDLLAGRAVAPETRLIEPLGIETRRSSEALPIADKDLGVALRLIRERACRGLRVGELLQHVPFSRRVLEARFKRLVGMSPHELILSIQLDRVRELLVETDLPHRVIAERAGFKHVEYMSVVFKKKLGVSPRDYRQSRRIERR